MTFFQILDSLLLQPLQLLFEVVYVNANRVIGNPGLSIIVLSLVMNFLVLPLYMALAMASMFGSPMEEAPAAPRRSAALMTGPASRRRESR